MEFWAAVAVVRRRWYIVVGCLVVFGVLALAVYRQVKPSYQATGSLVMTPATHAANGEENPFESAGSFSSIVAQATTDELFANQLVSRGGTSVFTVAPSFTNDSVLLLSTTAPTNEGALRSYKALVGVLQQEVKQLQEAQNAPPSTFYKINGLTSPSQATILVGTRIKALIVLSVIGLIVTLALVFGFDSWAASRRRKREAKLQRERMTQTSSLFQRQLTRAVERELGSGRDPDDEADDHGTSSEASGS